MTSIKMLGSLCLVIATITTIVKSETENCSMILDLCFVVDSSASICDSDPTYKKNTDVTCSNWNLVLSFMHAIVDQLDIGVNATQVGVVEFASTASRKFNLTRYTDKEPLLAAIDRLPYTKGNTNTSGAMDVMMNLVFNVSFGDRPKAANLAFFISDGRPTVDNSTVQMAIDRVHAANVRTVVVGVTNLIDEGTLKQLSSEPKRLNQTYFTAIDFNILSQILPTVQTQLCINCFRVMDLCFLIDTSASICDSDPNFNRGTDKTCPNWEAVKDFVRNAVEGMDIGENKTRVAAVLFATKGNRRWNLTKNMNKQSLLAAIDRLEYTAGETNISGGLDVMMNLVYNPSYGDRDTVPNVAIFIGDGRATNPSTVQPAIDRVHNAGVQTVAIGITDQIDVPTLKQLASEPKQINQTYFVVSDFNVLSQVLFSMQTQVCSAS